MEWAAQTHRWQTSAPKPGAMREQVRAQMLQVAARRRQEPSADLRAKQWGSQVPSRARPMHATRQAPSPPQVAHVEQVHPEEEDEPKMEAQATT